MGCRTSRLVKAATIALACGWFASHAARAADARGNFAVNGIGATSCADTVGAINHGQVAVRAELSSWLMGYISALNRVDPNTFDIVPVQSANAMTNLVVNICAKNGKAMVAGVANSIIDTLKLGALHTSSPLVTASFGGKSVAIRETTLKRLQTYLKKHKYLSGPVDGQFGPSTQAAIKAFQVKQKLVVNSLPDAETVIQAVVVPAMKK